MIWAFAREGGLPFSTYLSQVSIPFFSLKKNLPYLFGQKDSPSSDKDKKDLISCKVNERTRLPIYAIVTTTAINLLLALINIGSSVGFTAFISLIVAGYDSSLILAGSVMLYKRLTTPDSEIPWGPFRMGRRTGVVVTILALAYSFIGAFFSMWPGFVNPTPEEMNWCVLIYGAVLLFSVIFWFAYGRKRYTGPILEI